jgi:hypothetical protein
MNLSTPLSELLQGETAVSSPHSVLVYILTLEVVPATMRQTNLATHS